MATVRHLGLFPFCVSPYPPNSHIGREIQDFGPLTEYPFDLPTRLCARMWWTVKHYSITFDYSQYLNLSEQGSPGDFQSVNQSISVNTKSANQFSADYVSRVESGVFADASERGLVCVTSDLGYEEAARVFSWTVNLSVAFKEGENSGTFLRQESVFFATNWDNQIFGFSAPFARTGILGSPDLLVAMSFGFAGNNSYSQVGRQIGVGKFIMLDKERTFPISGAPLNSILEQESIDNLVLKPLEFWEYDPGDGLGPIYDSATGAQLRPFPQ
jgi:hypothetical protein